MSNDFLNSYFELSYKVRKEYEEKNSNPCIFRRPLIFPTKLSELDDINGPSKDHYVSKNFVNYSPRVHWTFICQIVVYEEQTFAGRPCISCVDSSGRQFNIIGYFDIPGYGRRHPYFDQK